MSTLDVEFMFIPQCCPLVSVFIDCIQEKVVDEPDISRDIRVEATLSLEFIEEVLPLGSKILGDLNPQAFNPCIVNAP